MVTRLCAAPTYLVVLSAISSASSHTGVACPFMASRTMSLFALVATVVIIAEASYSFLRIPSLDWSHVWTVGTSRSPCGLCVPYHLPSLAKRSKVPIYFCMRWQAFLFKDPHELDTPSNTRPVCGWVAVGYLWSISDIGLRGGVGNFYTNGMIVYLPCGLTRVRLPVQWTWLWLFLFVITFRHPLVSTA